MCMDGEKCVLLYASVYDTKEKETKTDTISSSVDKINYIAKAITHKPIQLINIIMNEYERKYISTINKYQYLYTKFHRVFRYLRHSSKHNKLNTFNRDIVLNHY